MASGSAKKTKGGNLMKPDIVLVCEWVKQAWDDIPAEMVQRSFLKCGISNALDGTEDDAIYSDDGDATDDDDVEDDNDVYDDNEYTADDVVELFGDSSDEEPDFDGFEEPQ